MTTDTTTITITIVLDAARDMREAGYRAEHAEPFAVAYRAAADALERAVNRRMGGGHSVRIEIVAGSYDGPDMQQDNQPEELNLWQHLHYLCYERDGQWHADEPDDALVELVRDWALRACSSADHPEG